MKGEDLAGNCWIESIGPETLYCDAGGPCVYPCDGAGCVGAYERFAEEQCDYPDAVADTLTAEKP